jgi:hypothetical protein
MAAYFPGVTPFPGPWHRGVRYSPAARVAAAAAAWRDPASWAPAPEGSGGDAEDEGGAEGEAAVAAGSAPSGPPHVVGVASALWDVARLVLQERMPEALSSPELPEAWLRGWQHNATAVLSRVASSAGLASSPSSDDGGASSSTSSISPPRIALHTTVPPRHDPHTGAAEKPYLGRRYFLEQLNAAARALAKTLALPLVDYSGLAARWADGPGWQAALRDQIHPGRPVALEAANVWLNLADQERRRQAAGVAGVGGAGSAVPLVAEVALARAEQEAAAGGER